MTSAETPPSESKAITFRVVRTPAGWRILGADSRAMSTIHLSFEAALTQARSMVDVLATHGEAARVIVDPDATID
jgi:hypothetical protein